MLIITSVTIITLITLITIITIITIVISAIPELQLVQDASEEEDGSSRLEFKVLTEVDPASKDVVPCRKLLARCHSRS